MSHLPDLIQYYPQSTQTWVRRGPPSMIRLWFCIYKYDTHVSVEPVSEGNTLDTMELASLCLAGIGIQFIQQIGSIIWQMVPSRSMWSVISSKWVTFHDRIIQFRGLFQYFIAASEFHQNANDSWHKSNGEIFKKEPSEQEDHTHEEKMSAVCF